MSDRWEKQMRERMTEELDTVKMTEETEKRILEDIHHQIKKERRVIMKYPKKRFTIILAAAITAVGAMTVIAAGTIAGLSSGSKGAEIFYSASELKIQAERELGTDLFIAEALSDGSVFGNGYVSEVEGLDKDGNTITTYPEVNINYGAEGELHLSIHNTVSGLPEDSMPAQTEVNYNGSVIRAKEDQYLFLPPDEKPSEEDSKLQEEGRLAISYGTETEEREVFKSVSWTIDGVEYLLSTFGDTSLSEMINLSKSYIDETTNYN